MMLEPGVSLELAVHAAVASIDDPEYPGISIVDLGLLETLDVADGIAHIGLIPTFAGCPALHIIADDVRSAVANVEGIDEARVEWLRMPIWSTDRIGADARSKLGSAFTVAVQLGTRPPTCPRCGGSTAEVSMFGPSRCRSVHRCATCAETVEVLRS